jgi:hypothetical protein
MEHLIILLKALESDETLTPVDDCITVYHPLVEEISGLAEDILITSNGFCNWGNIETLKGKGYGVFPLERDSFGWLIGGISTSKGIIAYG